jgi:D-alanyl-lipoteichoic acid acyltransferase DltB (MBOAT superfamily)
MAQFQFRWSAAAINEGVSWIALGFFFKSCLADNLAALFRDASTTNAYLIWLANVLFGLRIYYDFAGYSLIALGTARALGIRLTLNFASPYCATSSTEFWRRWHITLSQWFRDYLYVPLGGNRTRWWFFNIALVFVVSGIWHGAGWNFVCWGALHGAFLITNRLLGPRLHLPAPLGWLLTMFATFFAWLAFYESRTPDLTAKMAALFTPAAYSREAFRAALASYGPGDRYILGCFVGLTACVLVAEWLSVRWRQQPYSLLLRSPALACTVGMTLLLAPIANNGFIYFAF